MADISRLISDPSAWAALLTLIVMEVVLGIDNLIFISILTNKMPPGHRTSTRTIGIGMAMFLRLALLSVIAFIVGLTKPVFDLGIAGPLGAHGEPSFETAFSWRDLILMAGGIFLIFKATQEIHESVSGHGVDEKSEPSAAGKAQMSFASAIAQILLLDMVFSIDSILTAVGMTDHLPIMMTAVVVAVLLMMVASGPLAKFIRSNPTIVMLALGFLLMIGMTLIAEGFGVHVPKGYIYTAMAFSGLVEGLNMLARSRRAASASVALPEPVEAQIAEAAAPARTPAR